MALPLYDVSSNSLLADPKGKFQGLPSDAVRTAYRVAAEQLLGVEEPILPDAGDVQLMESAVALQILFLLEQGVTPQTLKTSNQSHPGVSTAYRDRVIDPRAARLAARAQGIEAVRLEFPMDGV